MSFTNLIRFKDHSGRVLYGDVPDESLNNLIGASAAVLKGHPLEGDLAATSEKAIVKENEVPPSPVLFLKPADALAGPYDEITVPPHAHLMDYEGELCFVISRDAKNIPAADADAYILGYTAGNDLSSRHWQRPPHSGGQYCYAKGFDGFAPIGPTIRAAHATDPKNLELVTLVNGEERQRTSTGDLVFGPREIVEFLSKGCTLRKGTVVMTGTPSGIASRRVPPPWLRKGDVVRVQIGGIGAIENKLTGF
ncbi:fumarylacetoacetate hydrolase family protein [Macrophomina phaseolina]|uniref:Fumarylacetoacetate hydrolase family protein n=1 Tax=Macrophomina phaseolina TaxID=35725 RepID=A0ABQ8GIN2_9PEZI|nr:fumarylacetoacetate hydrolase family protein [Macrophomina phaseolina]